MRNWTKSRNFLSSAVVLFGACGESPLPEDPVGRVTFEKTLNVVTNNGDSETGEPRGAFVSFGSSVKAEVIDARDGGLIGVTPCSFEVSEPVLVCLRAGGYTERCLTVEPGVRKMFDIDMQPIAQPGAEQAAHRSEQAIDSALGEIEGIIRTIEVDRKSKRKRR